jgi:hypothetical protein
MTPDDLFGLAGAAVLPGWAILILGPRRWPALNAVPQIVLPGALSLLYAVLVLAHFAGSGGGYGSLAEVRTLLSSEWMLLAGWVHYLAFDLAIGAWAAARMDRAGVGRIVQGFILPLIFLFGPLGLILALLTEAGLRTYRIPALLPRPREA